MKLARDKMYNQETDLKFLAGTVGACGCLRIYETP